MKIVKAGHEYQDNNVDPMIFIERIGRTCYKSEDKIQEGSAKKFVETLVKHEHMAMLEHATVYIISNRASAQAFVEDLMGLEMTKYIDVSITPGALCLISGNFRAFHELFRRAEEVSEIRRSPWVWMFQNCVSWYYPVITQGLEERTEKFSWSDMKVISAKEVEACFKNRPDILKKHMRHTVKFVCDRGVSHELVRHRPCSFAQESTRYANYSKDKFGSEITVIAPFFYEEGSPRWNEWKQACEAAEKAYMVLLNDGSTPQEARSVLPNSLKTEIVMTATEEEWQHICDLRAKGTTGAPHPQMVEIMMPWYEELKKITRGRVN